MLVSDHDRGSNAEDEMHIAKHVACPGKASNAEGNMTLPESKSMPYSVIKLYSNFYEEKYQQKFYPQDYHFAQAKKMMEAPEGFEPPTLDDVVARLKWFFTTDEDWIVGSRHNFSVFAKHFHRWIPAKTKKQLPASPYDSQTKCPNCGTKHNERHCPVCQEERTVHART